MKILAVGMNYAAHNKELNETLLPKEPVIFSKPESAIIREGKPFFVPDFAERFDYETELVVRISKLAKNVSERFAHRYYDEVTVGIDFTARDLQARLRKEGLPWDICKGFDGAAGLGQFIPKGELFDIDGCTTVKPEWKHSKTGNTHISDGNLDITVTEMKDPLVGGVGFGLRTTLFGYFVRGDMAWGIQDGQIAKKPRFYLSFNLDF